MQDKTSGERWLVTRWQLARGETPAPDTRYYRQFHVTQLAGQPSDATNQCDATQYWQGDQLFSLQKQAKNAPLPSSLTLQAYSYTTVPRLGRLGPLTLHIFDTIDIDRVQLQKADGQQEITLPVQQATSSLASDG
ncbi:MAG: hypothetical protein IMW89_05795 [Ktedonobacteraceae bacterium]|nr:hypothetical protein [Ktedonobacteraceae bacterium]